MDNSRKILAANRMEDNGEDLEEQLTELFAPWDAHAWENLRETHGDTAAHLETIIAAGVEPAAIRRYAERHGYSPRVTGWLEQAALHARRQQQARAAEPPAGEALPPE